MVYDFRSSRQPLSTNFCLSISFSLRQRRGAEWTSGGAGVARHWFGVRCLPIIFARLDQLGVNRGPKLLVACFPLLLVHFRLEVRTGHKAVAVQRRRVSGRQPRPVRREYSLGGISL